MFHAGSSGVEDTTYLGLLFSLSARPHERFWAMATVAECALHEHLLDGTADATAVRAAYHQAGAERPPDGDLHSTLTQLDFLAFLGLPEGPLTQARRGLLEGAGKQP